jgi:hypothetical protein
MNMNGRTYRHASSCKVALPPQFLYPRSYLGNCSVPCRGIVVQKWSKSAVVGLRGSKLIHWNVFGSLKYAFTNLFGRF